MKKKLALLFSFVALLAFVYINVANAQSPKTGKQATKVEQADEKKDVVPCCETKGKDSAEAKAKCCKSGKKTEGAEGEAKKGCGKTGKPCGGCSSKAQPKSPEQVPDPKR